MASVCTVCKTTHHDLSFLCEGCTPKLANRLREAVSVLAELGVTAERRDKTAAPSVGSGGGGKSLPVNLRAADAAHGIRVLIAKAAVKLCTQLHAEWVARCEHLMMMWRAEVRDFPDTPAPAMPPEPKLPGLDTRRYALWLIRHLSILRKKAYSATLLTKLSEQLRDAHRIIDTAPERIFAGHCPAEVDGVECGTQLMANPTTDQVACRKCKAVWDVTDWRTRALDAAETLTGQAAEISRALKDPFTGENLPSGTIRSWASRGKLTAVNEAEVKKAAEKGERLPRLYRIGDVRSLWAEQIAATYSARDIA